ncbi:dihydrofolate reductase, partial [bacterium]|nr:dihydrofolate reductase [bacterium]
MRKVILFNMMSLDGFFEGPNHNIDWHNVDEEFNDFALEQLSSTDGLMFGRATYELMAEYWPSEEAIRTDSVIANWMNRLPKYVFSRTLNRADWQNTTLVNGDAAIELHKIKGQVGRDLFIFGSADLSTSLIQNSLIDEYRVLVNPILLGQGTPLFHGLQNPISLQHI